MQSVANRVVRKVVTIIVVVAVALLMRLHFQQERERKTERVVAERPRLDPEVEQPERDESREPRLESSALTSDSGRSCDGRTRCPEMKSCKEAQWFLANCPGTNMDGDRDGVPCEDQWCPQLR